MNNIKTKIKMLAVMRGITLKQLATMLKEKLGKDYSYSAFLGKLNRETLSLKEAFIIAELLNYKLDFKDLK